MTCARREVSFVRSGYLLIHQRTLQKDSRKNHNLFLLFVATMMSMLFYKPSGCNGVGVSLSISLSAYRSRCCFFAMMVAGGWYCSRVRSGRNVTPPTPTTLRSTHTHTHSSLPPPSAPPPVHHPHFRPPPPPHTPPYHLQSGLISIRIDPGLPFPVTDIYKTIGQCARVFQLHLLFFSVRHCVFVSRQVTARLSRFPETCTPSEQLYQRNNRCTTPTTPHGHVKRSAETAPKRASVFASLKNTNKDVHTHLHTHPASQGPHSPPPPHPPSFPPPPPSSLSLLPSSSLSPLSFPPSSSLSLDTH